MKQHRIYKFGYFSLDATAKVLLREGRPVPLTRKAVETLLVLVENAGQVVPKEELLSAIWPDRVVDEANLTQNIATVRRALGAETDSPAYIETFAGRGYRILGPVEAAPVELGESRKIIDGDGGTGSVPETSTRSDGRKPGLSVTAWALIATGVVASILITIYLTKRRSAPPELEYHVSALTRLQGKERQPAISPDGKRLAFLWEQDDGRPPAIYLQVIGDSSPKNIQTQEGHYSSPAWSPDSGALAYLRIGRDFTDVLITSIESGETRTIARLTPSNYGNQQRLIDWSPDGQSLVVSHPETPNNPNGLYLVNIATGEKKILTMPEAMVGGDVDPRFSPDSKVISFIRAIHRSQQEVFSIPIGGGSTKKLTQDAKQISSHDWTSDGGGIVFASDRSGEFRLWKLKLNDSGSGGGPHQTSIYGEFPIEFSIAKKSGSLVYSVQQQDRNIWKLDLKEKRWTRIVASSAQDASPQYSPDGDKICFRSDRTGDEQLWVSDSAGVKQIQITRGALFPSVCRWSPDGRRIVFNNARTGDIYLADPVADGEWTVQSLSIKGVHPIFSPDGKFIYAGSTSAILKIAADGSSASEMTKTGGFSLGLSPDGKFLFFMQGVNDTSLWKLDTESGELSKAIEGLIPKCTSCWALDRNGVFYLGSGNESLDAQAIYYHDFGGGKDRKIIDYPEPLAPAGSGPFSLSPDLRNLLCVRVDPSNSDIMIVKEFR